MKVIKDKNFGNRSKRVLDFSNWSVRLKVGLVLMLLVPTLSTAFMFKNIRKSNGLSGVSVNTILKDSRGYMWFGTEQGLTRFDGYQYKSFTTENSSLPDGMIENLNEDSKGDLWIKTGSGYVVYDSRYESFNQDIKQRLSKMGVAEIPSLITVDSHKNFWVFVPGKGCSVIKGGDDLKYDFLFDSTGENSIPEGIVCDIAETPYGAVLTYTNGMLVGIDLTRSAVVWKSNFIAKQDFAHTLSALHSFCDRSGNIWVYGNSFLGIYNRGRNLWTAMSDLTAQWGSVSIPLHNNVVRKIVQDQSGIVWIATSQSGVFRVDVANHSVRQVTAEASDARSLLSNAVNTMYLDDSGLVWIGTSEGVSYYGNNIFKFDYEQMGNVTALAAETNGSMWIASSGRGLIYRRPDGSIMSRTASETGVAAENITSLLATRDGALWVGTPQSGLFCIKGDKRSHFGKGGPYSLGSDYVTAVTRDRGGNIWVGTGDAGVKSINVSTGSITSYSVKERNIASDRVSSVYFTADNRLVVGTADGVTVIDITNHSVKNYRGNSDGSQPFSNTNVSQVIIDSRGLMWVATHDGVNVLDMATDNLYVVSVAEGLTSPMIKSVCEDKKHNVWVTTSKGVSMLAVSKKDGKYSFRISNYDANDGLQSGDFNQRAVALSADGKVWFGGTSGLNFVQPSSVVSQSKFPTKVFFTQLYVFSDEIQIGRYYSNNLILPEALSELGKLDLKNSQNSFTIKFASNNYNVRERPLFEYWLEGDDDEWHMANSASHGVTFSHLSSGTYKLHVRVVGQKSADSESVLTIVIRRPFWLSWWALCIYGLIILCPIVWWRRIRPRRKHNELVRMAEVNEANLKQEVLEEVSDELRHPVANIIPTLTTMINEETDEVKKEELSNVHGEAMKMLSMLNSLRETFAQKGDKVSLEDINRLSEKVRAQQFAGNASDGAEDDFSDETSGSVPTIQNSVYVVDDSEEFITYLVDQLSLNYNIEGCSQLDEALQLIEAKRPDVILYKSKMTGMSGVEFCQMIRANENLKNAKIIEMTENQATIDIDSNDQTAIADDYISKPFTIKVIIDRINRQLGVENRALVRRRKSGVSNQSALDEQLFVNAESYVLENLSDVNLTVEMLAKAMNMSRTHLYKRLIAVTGKTPVEFIRYIRIRQAAQLLKSDKYNVSEVAYACGFNNPKYFSAYFKEEYGTLPSVYQANYRKKG